MPRPVSTLLKGLLKWLKTIQCDPSSNQIKLSSTLLYENFLNRV